MCWTCQRQIYTVCIRRLLMMINAETPSCWQTSHRWSHLWLCSLFSFRHNINLKSSKRINGCLFSISAARCLRSGLSGPLRSYCLRKPATAFRIWRVFQHNQMKEGQTKSIISLILVWYLVLLSNYLTGQRLFPTVLHIPINCDPLCFVSCYANPMWRQGT